MVRSYQSEVDRPWLWCVQHEVICMLTAMEDQRIESAEIVISSCFLGHHASLMWASRVTITGITSRILRSLVLALCLCSSFINKLQSINLLSTGQHRTDHTACILQYSL